eukprot:GEMP01052262.1.p1 GENE.GEMP01052262.1~~GEMP01052262.1.p1  ORF type:complete len:356 (+),score=74.02 GEMP01052262.1:177-1244(+)
MAGTKTSYSIDNGPLAFGLVFVAGMSTCLGAMVVYNTRLVKLASKKVLAAGLGIAAGVMAYVSFIEIFFKSRDAFVEYGYEERYAYALATLCFFVGVCIMKVIDALTHFLQAKDEAQLNDDADGEKCDELELEEGCCAGHGDDTCAGTPATGMDFEHPVSVIAPCIGHHTDATDAMMDAIAKEGDDQESDLEKESRKKLVRMGLNTAIAIAIHNFPEGVVTFVETLNDPETGFLLFFAVTIHNIPEGMCVAVPVFYATGNKHKAFLWALLSGISEPIAGGIFWIVFAALPEGVATNLAFAIMFGVISGMMITIVTHELLPTAHRYDPTDKLVTNTFILGMMIMALSLVIFKLAGR